MNLLAFVNNIRMGDIVVQLIFFLIIIAFIAGMVLLLMKFNQRNKKLDRIETKIDKLRSNQDQLK